MTVRPVRLGFFISFLAVILVGSGCSSSGEQGSIEVNAPAQGQVEDTVEVDLRLAEDVDPKTVSSLTFTLHYNNAFMSVERDEQGPLVMGPDGYRVFHSSSDAEMDFSVDVDTTSSGESDRRLLHIYGVGTEATPEDIPSHIVVTDLTVYDPEGNARKYARGGSADIRFERPSQYESGPHRQAGTQYSLKNTVRIGRVVTDEPGWITLWPEEEDVNDPRAMVGRTWVDAGTSQEVAIEVDEDFDLAGQAFPSLRVVLHRDGGTRETFEYGEPGAPDDPVMVNGRPVHTTFSVLYRESEPGARIEVRNQTIAGPYLVVDTVVASESADLVIHRNRGNQPYVPGIIGRTPVEAGVNTDVESTSLGGSA